MRIRFILSLTILMTLSHQVDGQSKTKGWLEKAAGKDYQLKTTPLDRAPGMDTSFVLWLEQPIDHMHPEKGSFYQRIFVQHKGFDRPVVVVTEGYGAEYANNGRHQEELTQWLNANQWVIEHRYFGPSRPQGASWQYLTVENAAADHHRVIQLIRRIYNTPVVTTGISKGGQTAIYHRTFYPNDADATVAYVAPINIAQEDPREIYFLKNVGNPSIRNKILEFQREVLKHRKEITPLLMNDLASNQLKLNMSVDSTLDYLVLEYPFSFWQWGIEEKTIPASGNPADILYRHLTDVIGLDSYCHPAMDYFYPFFYQAYTEIGYYGYDTTGLGNLLVARSGYYSNKVLAPKGSAYIFNGNTLQKVRDFIALKGNHIIYIYGENDPWTASAAMPTTAVDSRRFIAEGYHHGSRIYHLKPSDKAEVKRLLMKWLKIELPDYP
ncbi:MAG: peptidase [Bacteroidales bacterium]|nr:peptidase [Bacteroidales bacterium]